MKFKKSIMRKVKEEVAPATMTERHASSADLFDFDSSTFSSKYSDDENRQPFIIHSNSNFWFDDDDDVNYSNSICTKQNSKSSEENLKKTACMYENNQIHMTRRKRVPSFYDEDNEIFKRFFQEEIKTSSCIKIQQHDDKNISDYTIECGLNGNGNADYDGDLIIDNTMGIIPSTSSETVPICSNTTIETMNEVDDSDSINGDMTLNSCNTALFFASQLISSENDEEDAPNDLSDKEDDDLVEGENARIYRALLLARSLIRETYRERALRRYHFKRKRRKFLRHNGRYKRKSRFANFRPRINGKFVSMYTSMKKISSYH
jgi:hypothetical protein